jgi:VanZ family protein
VSSSTDPGAVGGKPTGSGASSTRRVPTRRLSQLVALLLGAWIALLLYLAVIELQPIPPDAVSWLTNHLWGALMVAMLAHLLLERWLGRRPLWHTALIAWGGVILGGLLIEAAQLFLPGRGQQLSDLTQNFAGACYGVMASSALVTWVRNRRLILAGTSVFALVGLLVAWWSVFAYQPTPPSTCPDDLFVPADDELAHFDFGGVDPTGNADRVPNTGTDTDTDLILTRGGVRKLDNGVQFLGLEGIARSETSAGFLLCNIIQAGVVSVEVWASTDALDQGGPTRLVSFSDGISPEDINFHLGQEGTQASVRFRNGPNSVQSMLVDDVFTETDRPYHLVTWWDDGTMHLAVDGVEVASEEVGRNLDWWADWFDMVVGNESTLNRAFDGTMFELTIRTAAPTEADLTAWHTDRPTSLGG